MPEISEEQMIKYHLVENHLTERSDEYTAQVQTTHSLDKTMLVERMLQSGSLLTKTDILAVLNGFEETVQAVLKEGGSISLPLFHTGFSISGVFDGAGDSYDPARHAIHINLSRGTLLRNLQEGLSAEKTARGAPVNTIIEVKDSVSGKTNSALTSSGVLEIFGTGIKVTGTQADNGVYFVASDGTSTKASTLVQNNPSSLIVVVPPLSAGVYSLKIVTQYSHGNDLKESRAITFSHTLTVES